MLETAQCKLVALRDELERLLDACRAVTQLATSPTHVQQHYSAACHASNSPQVHVFVHVAVLFSDLHIKLIHNMVEYRESAAHDVIVRPLSTVGYTSIVASVVHSRQWSN